MERERRRAESDKYSRSSSRSPQRRSNSRPLHSPVGVSRRKPKSREYSDSVSKESYRHTARLRESDLNDGQRSRNDREDEEEIEKPNYSTSGALQNALLTYKGVLLKYSEPPEARKPILKYRLYVFKKESQTDMYIISNQSCYLIGKDKTVCDINLKHPSISGQHCCLQYRLAREQVKLYLIDLNSSNGTFINKKKVESERYYELLVGDVISFGGSEREYVLVQE